MSDYTIADNFKRNPKMKPTAKLVGADGNVYNLLGICKKALHQYPNAFNELRDRVFACKSYAEALVIMMDYVEIE
jgi:hypothetical protein